MSQNISCPICGWLRLIGGKGRPAVQSIMSPGDVIILCDLCLQQSFQIFFTENNDMIQKLAPQGAAKPFDEWILPGTAKDRFDFFDARSLQEPAHFVSVNPIIIPEQPSGLNANGQALSCSLLTCIVVLLKRRTTKHPRALRALGDSGYSMV